MMLVIIFEQIFLLYFDAGGRSLLIGDCLENCWLATGNSCIDPRNLQLLVLWYILSIFPHKRGFLALSVDVFKKNHLKMKSLNVYEM